MIETAPPTVRRDRYRLLTPIRIDGSGFSLALTPDAARGLALDILAVVARHARRAVQPAGSDSNVR